MAAGDRMDILDLTQQKHPIFPACFSGCIAVKRYRYAIAADKKVKTFCIFVRRQPAVFELLFFRVFPERNYKVFSQLPLKVVLLYFAYAYTDPRDAVDAFRTAGFQLV